MRDWMLISAALPVMGVAFLFFVIGLPPFTAASVEGEGAVDAPFFVPTDDRDGDDDEEEGEDEGEDDGDGRGRNRGRNRGSDE